MSIGKRDAKGVSDIFSSIGNSIYNGLDSFVQAASFQIATLLRKFSAFTNQFLEIL